VSVSSTTVVIARPAIGAGTAGASMITGTWARSPEHSSFDRWIEVAADGSMGS